MSNLPPLSSIISLPSAIPSDAQYTIHDSNSLKMLLQRLGVPDSKLTSYCCDFGITQICAATLLILQIPVEIEFLISRLPEGSSGFLNVQSALSSIVTLDDYHLFLKSLGYPPVDPFTFIGDPFLFLNWITTCDPTYALLMSSLSSLSIEEFLKSLVQLHFSTPLNLYSTLVQELRSLSYALYSSAPLGSEVDRVLLTR
jgi:hypothetical protein